MTRRAGFTLIELLVAVALLTLVATAAVSWAVAQRRSGAAIEQRYERLRQLLACQQALREDLLLVSGSTQVRPDDDGCLRFTTLRRLPDESAGRHDVAWQFDAERQALVRSVRDVAGEAGRIALTGVAGARFVQHDQRGLILELQPVEGEVVSINVRGGP